jgi:hypothetical protein
MLLFIKHTLACTQRNRRDRIIVGYTYTCTYVISTYNHKSYPACNEVWSMQFVSDNIYMSAIYNYTTVNSILGRLWLYRLWLYRIWRISRSLQAVATEELGVLGVVVGDLYI